MSLKPEQIRIGTAASDNNKLIISGTKNGLNGIGQGLGSHADSQLTFQIDTTGDHGIKLYLKDSTIKGASTSVANQNSQIEAGSIGTADLADSSISTAKVADDAITSAKISGADGANVVTTYDYTGITSFSVPSPTSDAHAATKKYVDDKAQGLDFKDSVEVATTAALSATYDSTALTLTNSGAQAALAIDSVTTVAGDRVLVKDQATAAQNGIYSVTTVGDGSTNWVLTRATDFNSDDEITAGAYVLVTEGTTNKLNAYVLESKEGGGDPTLDSTASTGGSTTAGDLDWILFSGSATSVTGGDGIDVSGVEVSVDIPTANSGLGIDSSKLVLNTNASLAQTGGSLAVVLGGQTAQNTNASLQLTAAGTTGLAVKVDGSSVAVGTSGLQAAVLAKSVDDQSSANNVGGTSPGSTAIELDKTPATDCDVYVFINGVMMQVGDNTTTGAEVFFMPSGQTDISNVRAFNDLTNGDVLWFNPSVTGFDFDATNDVVKISFMSV